MDAAAGSPPLPPPKTDQLAENIKRRLLKKGVEPTLKIIHTVRKKHLQKSLRKSKRLQASQPQPVSESQEQTLAEEFYFRAISREYKRLDKILGSERRNPGDKMVGRPWERLERGKLRELAPGTDEYSGDNLKSEHLRELGEIFEERKKEAYSLILDGDDVELEDETVASSGYRYVKRHRSDNQAIQFLVSGLCAGRGITVKDWKFARMMKQSALQFTEIQLLKIVGELGDRGCWKQAMGVVEWVYSRKEHRCYKSRFVYTKLLAVLGKARRPQEALKVFQLMLGDCNIYPDMAAYHSISVTLGQAGLLKDLMNIVEQMKQKPSKGVKNVHSKKWDPILQPDVVVYNSVLNACIPSHQWKGVSWVFQQLRKSGQRPNGATYGLAMEVMLHAGKYELVHELFGRMKRSGEVPNALTYKVLVKTFWKEDKVDKAIDVVREMEQKGIVRTAGVYYELSCCLCTKARWQEAMMEIEKLKKLPQSKPLQVAFTGMILSSMDSGHINDCISIFEHMTHHCNPNIGAINAMIEVYGRNDMFSEAKALFEKTQRLESGYGATSDTDSTLVPDFYTYTSMLKASASAQQWEYFEYVYKDMVLQEYKLNQNKHVPLLVKASRAGKGHLLEHAFEAILEAGEIPHSSLFTEMVCRAIVQGDYARAVAIINTMAHAPFQVSEKEWTDLFERNRDRISEDCLLTLSDALRNNDMVKEATVSNLFRSLQTFKSASAKELPAISSFSSESTSNSAQDNNATNENLSFTADLRQDYIDFASDSIHAGHLRKEEPDFDSHACSSNTLHLHNKVSNGYDDFSDNEEQVSELLQSLDIPLSEVDDHKESDLPSADEILKAWKQSRQRDGFISPF